MPALVAVREEPGVRGFYQKRLAGGLKPIQALVAVERKLLHAIHGMWSSDQDFDGNKFCSIDAWRGREDLTDWRFSCEPQRLRGPTEAPKCQCQTLPDGN
jgi:hypothetical protein